MTGSYFLSFNFADNAEIPAITVRRAPWNQKTLMKRQHHPVCTA